MKQKFALNLIRNVSLQWRNHVVKYYSLLNEECQTKSSGFFWSKTCLQVLQELLLQNNNPGINKPVFKTIL